MKKPRLTYTLLSTAAVAAVLSAYWACQRVPATETVAPAFLLSMGAIVGQQFIGSSLKYWYSITSINWGFLSGYWFLYRGLTEIAPWLLYCPLIATALRLSYLAFPTAVVLLTFYRLNPDTLTYLFNLLPSVNPIYPLWFLAGLELANTVDLCIFIQRRWRMEKVDYIVMQSSLILSEEYRILSQKILDLTDFLLSNSKCPYCGSEEEALIAFPFDPAFHQEECILPLLRSYVKEVECSPVIEEAEESGRGKTEGLETQPTVQV